MTCSAHAKSNSRKREIAAERLGVNGSRVRQLLLGGILEGMELQEARGKSWIVKESSIEKYQSERRSAGWQKGKPRKPKDQKEQA